MKIASLTILLLAVIALGWTLFKPLAHHPVAADFSCYNLEQGQLLQLPGLSGKVYGVGLSYAAHIEETASEFIPGAAPPVFIKQSSSILRGGGEVVIPDSAALIVALESLEQGLGDKMYAEFPKLPSLLDYEVELAVVLLEDIEPQQVNDSQFVPKLGFTILNDLSARSLILLGEGRENRYDYWGQSKSFTGFTPIADTLWVPNTHKPNGIPCITLETTVNDVQRQKQTTKQMIYTPLEMLRFVVGRYPDQALRKGDIVAMGTPGGVIMSVPRWKVRLSAMLNLDRFTKLKAVVGQSGFLKAGDTVVTSGEGLNRVEVTLRKL